MLETTPKVGVVNVSADHDARKVLQQVKPHLTVHIHCQNGQGIGVGNSIGMCCRNGGCPASGGHVFVESLVRLDKHSCNTSWNAKGNKDTSL